MEAGRNETLTAADVSLGLGDDNAGSRRAPARREDRLPAVQKRVPLPQCGALCGVYRSRIVRQVVSVHCLSVFPSQGCWEQLVTRIWIHGPHPGRVRDALPCWFLARLLSPCFSVGKRCRVSGLPNLVTLSPCTIPPGPMTVISSTCS